jgi:hypothetical protein
MGCTSGKVVQKDTLEKDVDDDMSPNIILEYKREDSTSLRIFDDYTLLYLHNGNRIDGVLTKEEIRGLNKLYKTYGFIVADGGTESMLLHGSGPSSYTDPNLSSEMKSLIFVLTIRLNDELNEMITL